MRTQTVWSWVSFIVTLVGSQVVGQEAPPIQMPTDWRTTNLDVQKVVAAELNLIFEEAAANAAAHPQATYPVLVFDLVSLRNAADRLNDKLSEVPWYREGVRLHQGALWWELASRGEYPELQLVGLVGLLQEQGTDVIGYCVTAALTCEGPTSPAAMFIFHELALAADDERLVEEIAVGMRRCDVSIGSAAIAFCFLRDAVWLALEKKLHEGELALPATTKALLLLLLDDRMRGRGKAPPDWMVEAARSLPLVGGMPQVAYVLMSGPGAAESTLTGATLNAFSADMPKHSEEFYFAMLLQIVERDVERAQRVLKESGSLIPERRRVNLQSYADIRSGKR